MVHKTRTLKTLHDNNIGNNLVLAGDTHKNWVADLTWPEERDHDQETRAGAVGVEFAGTAVSSTSSCGDEFTINVCNDQSRNLVAEIPELQWQKSYYRGYYELQISKKEVGASYFDAPSLVMQNGSEVPLATLTTAAGANRLTRPVGGEGGVRNGALQR